MTSTTAPGSAGGALAPPAGKRPIELAPVRSAAAASRTAFYALLLRDVTVLRKHTVEFVLRTVIQPFLLVFVFLYVFPNIGQSIGGAGPGSTAFATRAGPGRGWHIGDVPGRPVGRPAAGAGVRLHAAR